MPQVLKDDVRDKIVFTARRLFVVKGYDKVSMSMIAREAGMAVGNIYRYFKSKDSLYKNLAQPVANKLTELFSTPVNKTNHKGVEEKITKFIEIYESEKNLILLLLENSRNSEFHNLKEDIIEGFQEAVIRWRESILLKETNTYDKSFIKAFASAFVNGIICIIADDADEEDKRKSLYRFSSNMKDGLYRELVLGGVHEKNS